MHLQTTFIMAAKDPSPPPTPSKVLFALACDAHWISSSDPALILSSDDLCSGDAQEEDPEGEISHASIR